MFITMTNNERKRNKLKVMLTMFKVFILYFDISLDNFNCDFFFLSTILNVYAKILFSLNKHNWYRWKIY